MTTEEPACEAGCMRIVGYEPCFSVRDVPRAAAHYQRLGFRISYHDQDYAFAHRDQLTIHLALTDDAEDLSLGAVYLHVDDADGLARESRAAGVGVVGPDDFDYGKREGSHVDPDGNLIR